jgi:hypothetical protein
MTISHPRPFIAATESGISQISYILTTIAFRGSKHKAIDYYRFFAETWRTNRLILFLNKAETVAFWFQRNFSRCNALYPFLNKSPAFEQSMNYCRFPKVHCPPLNHNYHSRYDWNGFNRAEAPRGALLVLWGGAVCMRNIFILNEIWSSDKIYILVRTLLFYIVYLSLSTFRRQHKLPLFPRRNTPTNKNATPLTQVQGSLYYINFTKIYTNLEPG